jgi:signal peptidase II
VLRFGLAVAALVLVLDQASKTMVLAWLVPVAPIELAPFLNLVVVWNPGVSFGMLGGVGASGPWLLIGLALLITAGFLVWLAWSTERLHAAALGLVIGGAVGNVIDRLRFGAVLDFVDLHLLGYHWPAFNVADAAITAGAVLLLGDGLLRRGERST